jgi:hypothetical protein
MEGTRFNHSMMDHCAIETTKTDSVDKLFSTKTSQIDLLVANDKNYQNSFEKIDKILRNTQVTKFPKVEDCIKKIRQRNTVNSDWTYWASLSYNFHLFIHLWIADKKKLLLSEQDLVICARDFFVAYEYEPSVIDILILNMISIQLGYVFIDNNNGIYRISQKNQLKVNSGIDPLSKSVMSS